MCEGLEFFAEHGRGSDDRLLAIIAVLAPGLGVDRISDMVCNILKGRYIAYTQEICQSLGIPSNSSRSLTPAIMVNRRS